MSVFDKVLRAGEGRLLRKLVGIADQINVIEDEFVAKSDAELRAMTVEFKERLAEDDETLDDIMAEAFATVREAAKRTLGQRAFDVQLMGGAALHLGNIAEMRTGEGKTLTGVFPAYLNALSGDGVHVITTNDYLARRDSEWMGRVHRFLGLEVGVIVTSQSPEERRHAYGCDITYGTNNEFGFDYLRDNMAWSSTELVQRGHNFAIVDEVDSILIDEARTPLIISGPAELSPKWYTEFAKIAARLTRDVDYECDEGKRTLSVNESAIEHVEDMLGIENLYETVNTPFVGYLNNALKAKELFARDKDYVVMNGEVMIVDEFTGRILAGRRYNEGMHQSIEAKENVEIKQENQTLATITLQNYFRLYSKLGGMTGTAQTEAAEFEQVYKLGCVTIPTNRDMVRLDEADVVFKTEDAKWTAVVEDIVERHEKGQPVLVGTTSVEKSEHLSGLLLRRGIPHEVLNAKYHDKEAAIIAEAGRRGAVTVATNMAGRGTDIMLGGNSETRAAAELEARGLSPVETPDDYEAAWPSALDKAKASVSVEHEEVTGLGGLYVLGTERHESRRIDNQLRGRSGRQGDPGESRFYLSLGDDLMRLFNAHMVESIMDRLNLPEDMPIESKMVSRSIRSAQTQIEQQNFEIRKNVLKYDEVLNKQRTVIYDERRRVLMGEDLHEQIRLFVNDVVTDYVHGATATGYAEDWDLTGLWNNLRQIYPVTLPMPAGDEHGDLHIDVDDLVDELIEDAQSAYDRREADLGFGANDEPVMRELERQIVLSVADRKWREHLYEMDYLQEGISLRSYGQRDPLVEYQREAFDMFGAMMEAIKEESVGFIFNVEVPTAQEQAAAAVAADAEQAEIAALEANLLLEQASPVATTPASGEQGTADHSTADPSRVVDEAAASHGAAHQSEQLAPEHQERSVADILGDAIGTPNRPTALEYSSPSVDGEAAVVHSHGTGPEPAGQSFANASRNQPCPCGSGRKFKRCHGAPESSA